MNYLLECEYKAGFVALELSIEFSRAENWIDEHGTELCAGERIGVENVQLVKVIFCDVLATEKMLQDFASEKINQMFQKGMFR